MKEAFEKWWNDVFMKTVYSLEYPDDMDKSYVYISYTARDEEVNKLTKELKEIKRDSDWLKKCHKCNSMFQKIYDYCPWCGIKALKETT